MTGKDGDLCVSVCVCGGALSDSDGTRWNISLFSRSEKDSFNFFSIDATNHENLGKYVNDSSKPNCKMNIIYHKDKPHLLLFAISDIQPNTEIRYNYGATGLWWRKKLPQYNKPFHLEVW